MILGVDRDEQRKRETWMLARPNPSHASCGSTQFFLLLAQTHQTLKLGKLKLFKFSKRLWLIKIIRERLLILETC